MHDRALALLLCSKLSGAVQISNRRLCVAKRTGIQKRPTRARPACQERAVRCRAEPCRSAPRLFPPAGVAIPVRVALRPSRPPLGRRPWLLGPPMLRTVAVARSSPMPVFRAAMIAAPHASAVARFIAASPVSQSVSCSGARRTAALTQRIFAQRLGRRLSPAAQTGGRVRGPAVERRPFVIHSILARNR